MGLSAGYVYNLHSRQRPMQSLTTVDPLIVTQAINVVYGVATLAVLALGLAVIFGLLGVLNIAHGEFVMIGAYCAYVTQAHGWPYIAALPLTLAVCAILGVAV